MKYEYNNTKSTRGWVIFLSSNLEKMCKNEMCMTMDNIDYDNYDGGDDQNLKSRLHIYAV